MIRWEYHVEQDSHHSVIVLNELGAEGWEMVAFDRGATVFKRPAESDERASAEESRTR